MDTPVLFTCSQCLSIITKFTTKTLAHILEWKNLGDLALR